jgi:hypothetical protein
VGSVRVMIIASSMWLGGLGQRRQELVVVLRQAYGNSHMFREAGLAPGLDDHAIRKEPLGQFGCVFTCVEEEEIRNVVGLPALQPGVVYLGAQDQPVLSPNGRGTLNDPRSGAVDGG